MILNVILAAVSTTSKTDPMPGWYGIFSNPMVLVVLGVLVFTMFMGKGRRGDEKQRQEMLKQLKRGDKIQTIGGIQGSVVRVDEQLNRVEVKVDESSNVKVWFVRSAIARVILDTDKVEAK